MSQLILSIIAIVLASAFCSCLEAAFFTISHSSVKILKEQKKRGSTSLLKIKERGSRTVITLVILNNAVTIAGSIYVGHLTTELYNNQMIGLITAILTGVIIFFGEIIPKLIGQNYSKRITLTFATVILILTIIFTPIVVIIEYLTKGFTKKHRAISEEELRMLTRMGEAEGSIEKDEQELIQRVFTLNDMTAKDIMTPRTVIEALPVHSTAQEVAVVILHKPYSRYPVYEDSLDHIVGVVQTNKLLTALARDDDNELVSYFMTAPVFVPEKKRVDDLMALFLSTRSHMAIVQDEFGGTTGVVTFEDVLEQLVGEIVDETDEVVDLQTLARETYNNNK
jgi:CBS domain containing-hemolysin-like protein